MASDLPALGSGCIRRGAPIALVALVAPAWTAHADDGPGFQFSYYPGYRAGGDFREEVADRPVEIDESAVRAVQLSLYQARGQFYELWYSRQRSDIVTRGTFAGDRLFGIDVHYLHAGGTVDFVSEGPVRPFLSGGLGATHLDPRGPGLDSETKPSLSLGAGAKIHLTPNVGLRFDLRWAYTLMENDSTLFCSGGDCTFTIDGQGFGQVDVGVGVFAAF